MPFCKAGKWRRTTSRYAKKRGGDKHCLKRRSHQKKPRLIQCLPLNRRLGPQRYLAICKVVSRAAGLRQEECSLTTEVETGSKDTNEKHGLNRHEFSEYSDHLLPDPQKRTELWENNMFNLGKSLTWIDHLYHFATARPIFLKDDHFMVQLNCTAQCHLSNASVRRTNRDEMGNPAAVILDGIDRVYQLVF